MRPAFRPANCNKRKVVRFHLPTIFLTAGLTLALCACGDIRTASECLISGNQYFASRDYEHAAAEYRRALKQDPQSSTALNNLGVVLNELGKYDEASAVLKRAVAQDPKNQIARYALARALTHLKNYDEAIENATRAVELGPDEIAAHRALAEACLAGGQLSEAIDEYRYITKTDGDDDLAHQFLGEVKRALVLKPDNVEARKSYASALHERGDKTAALAEIDTLIKQKPADLSFKELRSAYSK